MDQQFDMALMQYLADHRLPWLTPLVQLASHLGEVQGYVLVVTLFYVMFDKTLAVRLSVLVLLAMSLNHILKIVVKNPRPFVGEGTYFEKWAVSADNAKELATEYSTPSGHAMAGSAFYTYLYAAVRNRWIRVAAVLAIVLTGLSRPYLGVHYLEDILLGWPIGLSVALVAIRYAGRISRWWDGLSYVQQITLAVSASVILWAATVAINGWRIDAQPRAFLGYAGFLTGILIGRPLELKRLNFDPRSGRWPVKITRFALSVVLVTVTLELLRGAFAAIADESSLAGYGLQYVRYTAAGVASIYIVPLLFTRIGLAQAFLEAVPAGLDTVAHGSGRVG
ncbi:MAG: phosphatase PAP2 family protein [Deltaproteobacteria bacterium]|nr:phosphatase PAP2 family protein [Deltaproteobacteria bacterium]